MSSISAMGPHFFRWKNKLWVRGGRSRLALSENIEHDFSFAVYDRFMPSKPANLRDPYKIRFSIFFEKSKNVANPMVWRCREFFFSKISSFLFFSTRLFPIFIVWGQFCILRNQLWLKTTIFFFALSAGATKRGNATAERGNENSQRGSGKIPGFRAQWRRH